MDASAEAIQAVVESARWFARATELRVLYIQTEALLVVPVLDLLAAMEHRDEDPPSLWVFVETPCGHASDLRGWNERVEELRAEWDARRRALGPRVEGCPELPAAPDPGWPPLARFAAQVGDLARLAGELNRTLVLVLVPEAVEDAAAWSDDLRELLDADGLEAVRFAVVDVAHEASRAALLRPGRAVEWCTARMLDDAIPAEMRDRVATALAAHPAAPGPAHVGAAWPARVAPPPELAAYEVRRAADPAVEADGRLRASLLQAVAAAGRQDWPAAIRAQLAVCEGYRTQGALREALVMTLALGGYCLAAGDPGRAEVAFGKVATEATFEDLAAQAYLALGTLAWAHLRFESALPTLTQAVGHAKRAGLPTLALEAARLAGLVARDAGQADVARTIWQQAFADAQALDPATARTTCAAEIAWLLAATARERGDLEEAAELAGCAARLERPSAEVGA